MLLNKNNKSFYLEFDHIDSTQSNMLKHENRFIRKGPKNDGAAWKDS